MAVVRRASSGAGFVAGTAAADGVGGFVRRADFYAKLPRELREGSLTGGFLSIATSLTLATLLVAQTRAFREVTTRVDVVVDDADDDQFSLNFKLELPELSCEWAAVDVVDALGARRFNITGEQVYKHAMGASHYLGVEHAGGQAGESQRPPVYDDSTPLDHYGNARVAYEITASSFRRVLAAHKVLVVNFHAPWCSHCRRLAPVFEHAADVLRAKLKAKGRSRLAAALATADCSLEENADLCASQRIQAFPTIRVYKIGSALDHLPSGFDAIDLPDEDEDESESEPSSKHDHPKTSANAKNESSSDESPSAHSPVANHRQLQFESYHGRRVAEDLATYAEKNLEAALASEDAAYHADYHDTGGGGAFDDLDSASVREQNARLAELGRAAASAAAATAALGGRTRTSGCVLDGRVRLNRVPGAMYVTPHSEGHNVNRAAINMTHTIKHLSFGKDVVGKKTYVPRARRGTWARIPRGLTGGRFATSAADGGGRGARENTFVSNEPFTVHEHHMHVVGRTFEPLRPNPPLGVYEYTFRSNRFRLAPEGDEANLREEFFDRHVDGAAIRFAFDPSPMRVVTREVRKPTLEWLLGVCAIIGGVYTCSGLLSAVLENGAAAVKRRVGKAS